MLPSAYPSSQWMFLLIKNSRMLKKFDLFMCMCVGVENLKHYEAYEAALRQGLQLTLRYLKLLFFGPPRSGKSSARRRLLREILNLHSLGEVSISTGVAETNDIIIKKMTSESAAIAGSQWWSMKRSNQAKQLDVYSEDDLSYLAHLFYRLISKSTAVPTTSSEEVSDLVDRGHSDRATLDSDVTSVIPELVSEAPPVTPLVPQSEEEHEINPSSNSLSDSDETEIQHALEKLSTILQSDSPEELQQLLEAIIMMNMMDVGGQPAFLDMLPALTVGAALYLLFFRLDQQLQEHYPVRFLASGSRDEMTLESSYCIEEVLCQALASIDCFGRQSPQQDAESASDSQALCRALLLGTFKDQVNDTQVSEIDRSLKEKFTGTKLYQEGLLLKSSTGKMFFTLDNMNGTEESEMSQIRKYIERIIKQHFPATPIPASWLMFRIVLHLLNKPVVSLAQCREIGLRLSMSTPVEEALFFFHHDIGSLMHYSNIPSMQDTVVCNPQVIFDSISKLIIDKFQYGNRALSAGEVDEFQQKGQFHLSHIADKTECHRSDLLTLNQLVDVLTHHNIIAEIKHDEREVPSEPKFIMPAVLKYATEEELKPATSTDSEEAPPLFVRFKSGFVPFGVFCASIAHLITRQDSLRPKWQLCNGLVKKNKVTFIIDRAFFATLISRPQDLEIRIKAQAESEYLLSDICLSVWQAVVETLETVVSKMKYKPYAKTEVASSSNEPLFDICFTCCLEDSHSNHLMKMAKDYSGHYHSAECLNQPLTVYLKKEHLIWFSEVRFTRHVARQI